MRLAIYVGGNNVSSRALVAATEISRDSTDSISTATVEFYHGRNESVLGTMVLGTGTLAFRPREWQSIEIRSAGASTWDESTGTWVESTGTWDEPAVGTSRQFKGFITNIETVSPPGGPTKFRCTCADYGILLDRDVINATWPAGWTDRNIILDAFAGQSSVTVDPDDIENIASDIGAIEAKDITRRELLERICELTGGEWCVDYAGALKYYTVGPMIVQPVTWDESTETWDDTPGTWDGTPFLVTDAAGAANHRMDSFQRDSSRLANRITVLGGFDSTANEITYTASNLESQGRFGVLSATVVDRQITDSTTAELRARAEVAQRAFPLESGRFTTWTDGLDVGQTINIRNLAYSISGQYLIRAITIKQVATSCEYEVEFGARTPGLVTELRRTMARAKQPTYLPVARPAAGSVSVTNFASTIEPVRIVNALPTLPDANYTDNAIVLLTTDRKLYRRTGNDWTRNVNAADIEDQIQAGQLAADSVTAGTIAAGAIRAVDAVFEAAAIQNADIASLSASKLTAGTIDASVITVTNLNASNITTGSMSGTRLSDGTVADIKIQSGLSATKITTGTLNASIVSVTNLNASNITTGSMSGTLLGNGTVADIKIASGLSASKITTGILDASVVTVTNLNASNITTGTLSASRIGAGTITASVVFSSGTTFSSGIAASGDISTSTGWLTAFQGVQVSSSGQIQMGGAKVIGQRGSAVSDPTGGAVVDVECRAQLSALLSRLRAATGHGLIN